MNSIDSARPNIEPQRVACPAGSRHAYSSMHDATPPDCRQSDLAATMAFDPMEGIEDLETHLATLRDRAADRGFAFDRHAIRNELQAATFRLRTAASVRLLVSPTGMVAIESTPHTPG